MKPPDEEPSHTILSRTPNSFEVNERVIYGSSKNMVELLGRRKPGAAGPLALWFSACGSQRLWQTSLSKNMFTSQQ